MPIIPYFSEQFPLSFGPMFQGEKKLLTTWPEIVWAAITVGRENRSSIIRFGEYSYFELLYRTSIIFANLQEIKSGYISRSDAYDSLDPSEKGAVSYFVGLTLGKLFAEKFLDVPWLLHVDLFRSRLNLKFGTKKSKPDLIGLKSNRDWIIMEAKGRTGTIISDLLLRAKEQTRNLRKIAGQYPSLRVALASYFISYSDKHLQVNWADPEEFNPEAEDIQTSISEISTLYYSPIIELFKSRHNNLTEIDFQGQKFVSLLMPEIDLVLGIYPDLLSADFYSDDGLLNLSKVVSLKKELSDFNYNNIYIGSDGILVILGKKWEMKTKPITYA